MVTNTTTNRQNFPNVLSWHHSIFRVLVSGDSSLAQLIFFWHCWKKHCLRCCRGENDCSVIFPLSLSPWAIMEWLLICLDNMKGAGALISIKTVIGLNYLYDCPLELLSMLFSLSFFSKRLSPARTLCEVNTMEPVDSPQKGIALESHTSAGWPLAMGRARPNPCGHPVRSSLGNGIDSKCMIGGVHINEHPNKWHLPVFSICTSERFAWVGEMLKSVFSQDQNILPDLTQMSICFCFAIAKSISLYSVQVVLTHV